MADDLMILAKEADYSKMVGRTCYLSEKIDGVPGIFAHASPVLSRSGTVLTSCPHIAHPALEVLQDYPELEVIGELHLPGRPFKESSGAVRRKEANPNLMLGIWDVRWKDRPDLSFEARWAAARRSALQRIFASTRCAFDIPIELIVPQTEAEARYQVLDYYAHLKANRPYIPEGVMIRFGDEPYKLGRSWGMMRYVPRPTIDLRVEGLLEATANKRMKFLGQWFEKDDGLNAVGTILVSYKGEEVGVGPGVMSHQERVMYWRESSLIVGKIIKVQHKPDPSYNALRQPTFAGLHPDKSTPDA